MISGCFPPLRLANVRHGRINIIMHTNHPENLMKCEFCLVGLNGVWESAILTRLGWWRCCRSTNHTLSSKRFNHSFLLLATKRLSGGEIRTKIFMKLKNLKCYQKEASAFFLFFFGYISSLNRGSVAWNAFSNLFVGRNNTLWAK